MKKMIAALAMTGLLAGGTALTALAQAPKPTAAKPADPKPADPKSTAPVKPADPKAAAKGSVTIKPDAKGRFRISVKDEDGKTLLMSAGNGFETEKEAKDAIEEIKGILAAAKVTVEKAEEKKDK